LELQPNGQPSHEIHREKISQTEITACTPLIVFRKEVQEGTVEIGDILVSQNFFDPNDQWSLVAGTL
jgi:hypothetical protein